MMHLKEAKKHVIWEVEFCFQLIKCFNFSIMENTGQQINTLSYPYGEVRYLEELREDFIIPQWGVVMKYRAFHLGGHQVSNPFVLK